MEGAPRQISVALPSMNSPRAAVARQSVQTALNRSIPAQGQGLEDFTKPLSRTNKRIPSPRMVRTAPNVNPSVATNEFVGRTRTGPSRQPAKTSVVDFGGIPLHPRERMNVRGIDGFYPPLRMKSGTGTGKFAVSEPVSTAWGPKFGPQETDLSSPSTTSLQQYNIELSPNQSDLGPDSIPNSNSNTNWLQKRNNEQSNNAVNNSSLQGNTAKTSRNTYHTSPSPDVTGLQQPKKPDAAWVRAFKVKQHRNNRYKEMETGAKPTSSFEDGNRRWGLPD
ncbi:uncharacterized protein LOC129269011 isoform X2 [Lytechinus pictus]|uniref:uncharacterized protein LOC129269011 isoform X2 n=1 Tax=Lytechinus pictus TaxID=7653 RepID=UPI0030B9C725